MTSDPGTTAELVPFCETFGLYFSDAYEPESAQYILDKDILSTLICDDNAYNITPGIDNVDDYYTIINESSDRIKDIHVDNFLNESDAYVIDIYVDEDI